MKKVKAVFLDRDGVINKYPGHGEYVKSWRGFAFLPSAKASLRQLKTKGYKLFVISNQAGVAKGIYSQKALDTITRNMLKELASDNIDIDAVYYCTHRREDNCACRKPKTGLVKKALGYLKKSGLTLDLARSYFVGDTVIDMQAGRDSGLRTILVFSGKEKPENKPSWDCPPDFTALNLKAAVDIILSNK
jgi:D-glycero-D-manno-heptose 1,7-bisphosphate phosphatase